MSYYFPFGRLNTVDSSSFAGLSTTASYAFFANTSSFASKAEYPGAQGDPGNDIVCSCPAGYMACPGLSVPGYALVCLEIAPVCSPGTTIACPPSVPSPTTSTTSTTSTSTTSTSTTSTSTTIAPIITSTTTSTTSTSTTTTTTTPGACYTNTVSVSTGRISIGSACGAPTAITLYYNVAEAYTDPSCNNLASDAYYGDGAGNYYQVVGGQLTGPFSCTSTTTTTTNTACYTSTVSYTQAYANSTFGKNSACGDENEPTNTLYINNSGIAYTDNTCASPASAGYYGIGLPTDFVGFVNASNVYSQVSCITATSTSTTSTSTTTTTCYSEILYMSDTKATPQLACAGPAIYNYYKDATKLYTTNDCGTFAAVGYYSNGVNWYQVTGAGNVSAPTPCGTYPTTTSTTTTTTLSGVTGDCYKMTNTTLSTATMNYTSPTFGATTISIPGEQTRYVCSTVYPYQTPPVSINVDIEECGTTCTVNSNCTGCSAPAPTTTTTTTVAGTTTTTTAGPTTTSTTTTTTLPQCAPGVEYECTVGETTVCCNSAAEPFCCDGGGTPICSATEPCPT